MLRREFLAVTSAALAPGQGVFFASPGKGTAIMAHAYYTRASGVEMRAIEQRWSKSDLIDIAYVRTSKDNGRTWSSPVEEPTGAKRPGGTWRKHQRAGYVDPRSKRLFEFWMEAVLPTDDPLEGLRNYCVYYKLDGGRTIQLIHRGGDSRHPLPGLELGRNGYMLGDNGSVPLTGPDGTILLPVEIFPEAEGKLYNPGGGYTWSESAVLHGRWKGGALEWTMSSVVRGDPAKTTRGMVEPTIAFLGGRRVLMIMRGSNDRNPQLAGVKWMSFSEDAGRTFGAPAPWTYDDGSSFYSPSSCSRLLTHSNGRLYWLGNITPENPRGNRPRYPFVIGEVDLRSGLLRRPTVRQVDNRSAGEDEILSLSNFYAHEDRETREIVLYMTRLFAHADGWLGDAMRYRIPP